VKGAVHARSAVLLGATGLVGRHCLDLLLADDAWGSVTVFARKPVSTGHPKLHAHVLDFDTLRQHRDELHGQDLFCCLGTTIGKAGSREVFYKVDFTYIFEAARASAEAGADQILLVSALGAHPGSRVFYNRVKGQVEQAVRGLSFRGTQIFRPSLLLGDRQEFRRGERLASMVFKPISVLLVGPFRKYRPVAASDVALAMVRVAKKAPPGVNVFESNQIAALAS
jgi:uncharacterized protein YbjT (DUF2867 family)